MTAGLAVLLLAVPAVHWAAADWYAASAPRTALEWVPHHPAAHESLAVAAIESGDTASAIASAREAIALRPLESRSWRVLAAAYEAGGRLPEAAAAHRAAIAVSPSNAQSHLWLASRELEQGAYATGIAHVDRALRASPGLADVTFPAIAGGLGIPAFRAVLVDVLAARPAWRGPWLGFLAERVADVGAIAPFFAELATRSALTEREASVWIHRLEREQRWGELRAAWLAGTDERGARTQALIHDGGFDAPADGYGLGWRIARRPGVVTTIGRGGGSPSGGPALTLQFLNQRVPFREVSQLLLLPPGRYTLRGEVRADGLRARRGLRWVVHCATDPAAVFGMTESYNETRPWTKFSADLDVPPNCPAQRLVLELEAQGPSEEWIGGTIRFDGLAISASPDADTAHTRP